MSISIADEFKQYADFSVRVDRYFNLVNIYGRYHDSLKLMYAKLPDAEITQRAIDAATTTEEVRTFLLVAANLLNSMATTNAFMDAASLDNKDVGQDCLNFAFYTAFCFQWTLFENFVKKMIRKAANAGVLPENTKKELENPRVSTKKFFDLIESGQVFGRSPFVTVLPVPGWIPETETCDYTALDKIRKLRNDFIHGIEKPEITAESLIEKQRRYERSMWILRKFAENVHYAVQNLLARPHLD